jgi:hypothetical protein
MTASRRDGRWAGRRAGAAAVGGAIRAIGLQYGTDLATEIPL